MSVDPSVRLAELSKRTWVTAAEFEALNREYDEALADIARSVDVGGAAQLATIAGINASDRQSLKRKAERWKAAYRAMPAIEQAMLLAGILEVIAEKR